MWKFQQSSKIITQFQYWHYSKYKTQWKSNLLTKHPSFNINHNYIHWLLFQFDKRSSVWQIINVYMGILKFSWVHLKPSQPDDHLSINIWWILKLGCSIFILVMNCNMWLYWLQISRKSSIINTLFNSYNYRAYSPSVPTDTHNSYCCMVAS